MSQIKYNNKTIKKLEYNTSEVKKMYYDGDIAYGVDGGSQPTYNEYEYIKTVGTATTRYTFNTGFHPTTAHTIEVKFQLTDNSVDWGRIFGWSSCAADTCDSTQYRFSTVTGYWGLNARRGNTNGTSYKALNKGYIDITCTIPISSTTYWSFTTEISPVSTDVNINSGTFNSPSSTPLHLLGFGDNTWGSRGSAHLKYYYLKVYDKNHNLVKHYVASDYNGVPCFYEKVDGEYIIDTYTGLYHGTLRLGNPVN